VLDSSDVEEIWREQGLGWFDPAALKGQNEYYDT
jgi:hypothetical protein